MKVKQAPFVMYASLKEAAVRKGDRYVALAFNWSCDASPLLYWDVPLNRTEILLEVINVYK